MKPISSLIADWAEMGWTKKAAAATIIDSRLHSDMARGNGNKAAKRAAQIETAQWYDHHCRLSAIDVEQLAAIYDRS